METEHKIVFIKVQRFFTLASMNGRFFLERVQNQKMGKISEKSQSIRQSYQRKSSLPAFWASIFSWKSQKGAEKSSYHLLERDLVDTLTTLKI